MKKEECFFNKKKKKNQVFILEKNIIQNNFNNYLFFDKDFIEFIKSYNENLYNSQEFQFFLNNNILKNLYYDNEFDIVIDSNFFYEQKKLLYFIKINYSELYDNIIFKNFLYKNSIKLYDLNYKNSQFYFKKVDDK
jgi:hypothetical protein